jgi:uncharacterized membrane protein
MQYFKSLNFFLPLKHWYSMNRTRSPQNVAYKWSIYMQGLIQSFVHTKLLYLPFNSFGIFAMVMLFVMHRYAHCCFWKVNITVINSSISYLINNNNNNNFLKNYIMSLSDKVWSGSWAGCIVIWHINVITITIKIKIITVIIIIYFEWNFNCKYICIFEIHLTKITS